MCDRILCPMKASIRRYCNEEQDILSVDDMRIALSERYVKGTSACVCLTDVSKKTLDVQSIEGFSSYHNLKQVGCARLEVIWNWPREINSL